MGKNLKPVCIKSWPTLVNSYIFKATLTNITKNRFIEGHVALHPCPIICHRSLSWGMCHITHEILLTWLSNLSQIPPLIWSYQWWNWDVSSKYWRGGTGHNGVSTCFAEHCQQEMYLFYFPALWVRLVSGIQLRSRKNLSGSWKQGTKGRKKTMCVDESAMSTEVMQELKLVRSKLCRQMGQLSNRLSKIECVISKLDEIGKIIPKIIHIEESATKMKILLNFLGTWVGELENNKWDSKWLVQKNHQDLFTRIVNLEWYSCDYNSRIISKEEQEGKDCITILLNYLYGWFSRCVHWSRKCPLDRIENWKRKAAAYHSEAIKPTILQFAGPTSSWLVQLGVGVLL